MKVSTFLIGKSHAAVGLFVWWKFEFLIEKFQGAVTCKSHPSRYMTEPHKLPYANDSSMRL